MENSRVVIIKHVPWTDNPYAKNQVLGSKLMEFLGDKSVLGVVVLNTNVELRVRDYHYLQRVLSTFFHESVEVVY